MNILRHPELDEREFGRAAVRLDVLRAWAGAARIFIPRTVPDINEFEAVQLESLLAALAAGASDYEGEVASDAQVFAAALAMLNDPEEAGVDQKMRLMIEEERDVKLARWFVGGRVHVHWRRKLEQAIAAGQLPTFDALTGLPTSSAPPPDSGSALRWTPERLKALADDYAATQSLRATGENFGITESRVRELLKPKAAATAKPTSPFDHPFKR